MANETYLSNLINPEVMGQRLSVKLTDYIKFSPLARIGMDLQGNAGNTITVPYFKYIGDASDVAEFTAISLSQLQATTFQATVKKVGKAVEITDEAMYSAYGNPMDEVESQLLTSLGAKVDNDCLTALDGITGNMLHAHTGAFDKDVIADALVKFGEDINEQTYLFINPADYGLIRKDADFVQIQNGQIVISGQVGQIYGTTVIVTNKLAGVKKAFLLRADGLGIEMKRNTLVEMDRDILKKSTVLSADIHYVAYLRNANKAVKITYTV